MADGPISAPLGAMDRKIKRSWRRDRRVWFGGAALAVILLLAGLWTFAPAPGTLRVDAGAVDLGAVVRDGFQDYLPVRAEVEPAVTTLIDAVSGGQVLEVLQSDGALVTAGAPLARLSNPSLTLDVTSREAEIAGRMSDANAQIAALQRASDTADQDISDATYALHKAERELWVRQSLADHGVVGPAGLKPYLEEVAYQTQRIDALKLARARQQATAEAQTQEIRATRQSLQQNLDVVRSSLKALTLTAPASGRLVDFVLKPGQAVTAGAALGRIDGEGAYKLKADVDEFYAARLHPGLEVSADLDGQTVRMSVAKVLPQVVNGRITAELAFAGASPSRLTRGEAFNVRIQLGATAKAVLAPNGPWLAQSGGAYAFVLAPSGDHADKRTLTVGRRNPEVVEVLSGLQPGERIVLSNVAGAETAQHLQLTHKAKP